jgi:hypothetical protein
LTADPTVISTPKKNGLYLTNARKKPHASLHTTTDGWFRLGDKNLENGSKTLFQLPTISGKNAKYGDWLNG